MVVKRHLRHKPEVYGDSGTLQSEDTPYCPLCGRELPDDHTTDEHHLVPRSKGGREKFRLHRICHQKIHTTLTETELARHYNNWDALKSHPDIADFIRWVEKRPPGYIDRNRKTRAMRRR